MSGDSRPGVVIAGGGQAGAQAAISLRQEGFDGRIVVVAEENILPYQRPPLSKASLKDGFQNERLLLRPGTFYSTNNIEVLLGGTVQSIDRSSGHVELRAGGRLPFDHLILAVGARNRLLPIEGSELEGVHLLRTIAEAEKLRAELVKASHLVIIGGGFIGLEVAATARALGAHVTVLEAMAVPMGRAVSSATSAFFVEAHRAMGNAIVPHAKVSRILGRTRPEAVETDDGMRYPCDLVLIAVGIVPNVEIAQEAGLTVRNGIVVDAFLTTDDPRIFAVGDCAAFMTRHADGPVRLESVQNAIDQGKSVASRIVGGALPFDAVPWFWSDQGPYKLQICGITAAADHVHVATAPDGGSLAAYCFRGDRLLGIEAINRPAEYMLGRRILGSGLGLMRADVERPDFDLKSHIGALSRTAGAPAASPMTL